MLFVCISLGLGSKTLNCKVECLDLTGSELDVGLSLLVKLNLTINVWIFFHDEIKKLDTKCLKHFLVRLGRAFLCCWERVYTKEKHL